MDILWKIKALQRNATDGGVMVAHWSAEARDGSLSSATFGAAQFTPDASAPGFVPFENLTEADVLAWVWASVGKEDKEALLAQRIEAQRAPAVLGGLPW